MYALYKSTTSQLVLFDTYLTLTSDLLIKHPLGPQTWICINFVPKHYCCIVSRCKLLYNRVILHSTIYVVLVCMFRLYSGVEQHPLVDSSRASSK